jgi:hypothetical protein
MPVARHVARIALVLACIALALPAAADENAPAPAHYPIWDLAHIEFGVRAASLADLSLSGGGTLPGGGMSTVSGTGRSFGLGRVPVFGAEFRPEAMVGPHVALGLALGYAGAPIDATASVTARDAGLESMLSIARAGATADLVWTLGSVEVRTSATVGVQVFTVPMHGFAPQRCGRTTCYPNLSATTPYFEPRVAVSYVSGPWSIGVFMSGEVVPAIDGAIGIVLAVHDPSWARASGFAHVPDPYAPAPPPTIRRPVAVDLHADGSVTPVAEGESW